METLFLFSFILLFSTYFFQLIDAEKLIVGVGFEESNLADDFEVIDLESNVSSCSALPNFPQATYGSVAGISDGLPLVCGGVGPGPSDIFSDCYLLKNNTWVESNKLNVGRAYAAMAKIGDNQILVSGGQIGPGGLESITSTVEHLVDGEWEQDFPDLPAINYFHCTASLNSTSVIAIGGVPSPFNPFADKGTFIFSLLTKNWTKGPELQTGRYHHSCSMVSAGEGGDSSVIVAGGVDGDGNPLSTVEILDPESGEWRYGPELPYPILRSAMADDKDGGVVLVGGQSSEQGYLSSILRLENANVSQWTELPQKLSKPRYFHVAFFADIDC